MMQQEAIIPYDRYARGRETVLSFRQHLRAPDALAHFGLDAKDGKLHVLFAAVDVTGCGFYRAFTPATLLSDLPGVVAFPSISLTPPLLDWAHVIIWQRQEAAAVAKIMAQRKDKVHLYDIDDYLLDVPKHNPSHDVIMKPSSQAGLRHCMRNAQAFTAPSAALLTKLQAVRDVPGFVLPNAIIPERFITGEEPRPWGQGKVRIGWQGSPSHVRDLRLITPALRELGKRADVQVVIFGWESKVFHLNVSTKEERVEDLFDGIDVERHAYVPVHEYSRKVARLRFDIGLAPLEPSMFNACKSPIKWEEYAALGIPSVLSDFGPYHVAAEDGQTALLAGSPADFTRHLTHLLANPAEAQALGARAKSHVLQTYGPDAVRQQWVKVLEWAVGTAQSARR